MFTPKQLLRILAGLLTIPWAVYGISESELRSRLARDLDWNERYFSLEMTPGGELKKLSLQMEDIFSEYEFYDGQGGQRGYHLKRSESVSLEYFGQYPELEYLCLTGIGTVDLTGLQNLKRLANLDLYDCTVIGLESAISASLKKLKVSRIADSPELVIGPGLEALELLNISDRNNHNVHPESLRGKNIRTFIMSAYQGGDFSFLRDSGVEELYLTSIDRLSLEDLPDLPLQKLVTGRFTVVTDLPALARFPALRTLDVFGGVVHSLPPLRDLNRLDDLTLWSQMIFPQEEADALLQLPLRKLRLHGVGFPDMAPVLMMPVELLFLDNVVVPEDFLDRLGNNENIRFLGLNALRQSERLPFASDDLPWDKLGEFSWLTGLDISGIGIRDVSWIAKLPGLQILLLPPTIADLAFLRDRSLEFLYAPGVADLAAECRKYNIEVRNPGWRFDTANPAALYGYRPYDFREKR